MKKNEYVSSQTEVAVGRPLILDGRNFLQADTIRALGFEYYGVGRPVEEPAREAIA